MGSNDFPKLPHWLRCQAAPRKTDCIHLVDTPGKVWAAALVFARSPRPLRRYGGVLEEAHQRFLQRWDLKSSGPCLHDFLEDKGELAEQYHAAL